VRVLSLPPLLTARAAENPRADAVAAARTGCDGGLLVHRVTTDLAAALVLAPDVPLGQAVQMAPLGAVAARDAIGASGDAEVPVHLTWENRLIVDGAESGGVEILADHRDARTAPDWIVILLAIRRHPDEVTIRIDPTDLLESWSRHLLHRLHQWQEGGPAPLHAELQAAAWERETGDPNFLGRDEALGRLRRDGAATALDPLTDLLEAP
jgi:hypothetical protein